MGWFLPIPIVASISQPGSLHLTAQNVITNALRDVGVLAEGQTPSTAMAKEGLQLLQQFVDSLPIKRGLLFARSRVVLPLTSGQQVYTIGSGANLSTPRPVFLEKATCLRVSGTTNYETKVAILTQKQYAAITVKAITTGVVEAIFYDHGYTTSGFGSITVYPYPDVSGISLVLYGPVPVSGFNNLKTSYIFPPGYAEMFEFNLALRCATRYQVPELPPLLQKQAADSLRVILSANFRPEELTLDPALTRQGGARGATYQAILNDAE